MASTKWIPFLPDDIFTNFRFRNLRRLKVESIAPQEAAFEGGLTYRTYYKFALGGSDAPVFLKYTITGDVVLTLSDLSVTEGDAEYTVWTQAQATEGTAFTTPVNVYQTNLASTNSNVGRSSFVTVETGGSVTFTGSPNDLVEITTATGGNNASVLSPDASDRGFPATVAYVRIARLNGANKALSGIIKQEWTDRP
jgi:hypothetical protein